MFLSSVFFFALAYSFCSRLFLYLGKGPTDVGRRFLTMPVYPFFLPCPHALRRKPAFTGPECFIQVVSIIDSRCLVLAYWGGATRQSPPLLTEYINI